VVKLKMLKFYKTEDVPDHILEEMTSFAEKLAVEISPLIMSVDPNIALAALNWVHVGIVKRLISEVEGEFEQAAKMTALSILKNAEILADKKIEW
jgi:hypothetical protein